MVYGLGRRHAIGMYTPLARVQITADYPQTGMPTIREVTHATSHSSTIQADPYKRTIALFISEVLFHVLRHPMSDEPMFTFLEQSIETLENSEAPQNFHLLFLTEFASKLGFAMEQTLSIPLTRTERQEQLKALCTYFEEHVETWSPPRSLDVLMEVFD